MGKGTAFNHRVVTVDHDVRTRNDVALSGDVVVHHLMIAHPPDGRQLTDKTGFTE